MANADNQYLKPNDGAVLVITAAVKYMLRFCNSREHESSFIQLRMAPLQYKSVLRMSLSFLQRSTDGITPQLSSTLTL